MTRRGWAALWIVYTIWGSTYLGIELAGETMPPVFAAGVRFLIAGVAMATWASWRRGPRVLWPGRRQLGGALLVGLLLPGANAILFVAERHVPTSVAALVFASVPLWLVAFRMAAGDRPRLAPLAGTAIGFGGVALLLSPSGRTTAWGLGLVVLSTLTWATGSFLAARLPLPADSLGATAIEMLAGAALLLPLGIAFHGHDSLNPATFSGRSLFGLAYLIVFGSLAGFTAYVWLLANAPIGTVATYAYVNPIVAIGLGTLVLHEGVTVRTGIGAAVVIAAVAVVIRYEAREVVEPFRE
jgi:drug/metabolite transporter (DMT)-like permease